MIAEIMAKIKENYCNFMENSIIYIQSNKSNSFLIYMYNALRRQKDDKRGTSPFVIKQEGYCMDLDFKVEESTLIVKINCEIDHHSCDKIRDRIDTTFIEKNVRNILIDMSDVYFMDSSGIGLIMGRYKFASKLNGQAGVISGNENVDKILKMSGIEKFVHIYSNLNDALKRLNEGDINNDK